MDFTVTVRTYTGAIKDNVTIMTRWHLKCEQEGWTEDSTRVVNSGKL
jgi:hypothetical protein